MNKTVRTLVIDATRPYKPHPIVSLPSANYWSQIIEKWEKYGLPGPHDVDVPRQVTLEEEYLKHGTASPPKKNIYHWSMCEA